MTTARIKRAPADAGEQAKPILYIATPAYGCMATTPYIAALRQLTRSLDHSGIPHTVELLGNESLITRARNKCVAMMLKTNATHLVFIDADVGFNPHDLAAMVRSGFDVVGGAYPMKAIGWGNVAEAVKEGKAPSQLAKLGGMYAANPKIADMATGRVDVLEREGGKYIQVDDLATGFMVIRREALERFINHYRKDIEYVTDYEPVGETHHMVFQADRDPVAMAAGKPARYLSEDYWFCRKWQQMGGECYLSIQAQLTHTGTYRFEGDVGLLFEVDDESEGEATGVGSEQRPVAEPVNAETVHGRRDVSSGESRPVPSELQVGTNGSPAVSPSLMSPAHAMARHVAKDSYESGRPLEPAASIPPVLDSRYASLPVQFVDP